MKEGRKDIKFLGTGWSFPPEFSKKEKRVLMTSGEEDIRKSLEILLTTSLGERIMLPGYGCDVRQLLFEPLTTTLKTYISELIKNAILYHEPRIKLNKVSLDKTIETEGYVDIQIDFTIKTTNSRTNYVYPFYIEEAINQ